MNQFDTNIEVVRSYFNTLTSTQRVVYKMAYNFAFKYNVNTTQESAHNAGVVEVERINSLQKILNKYM